MDLDKIEPFANYWKDIDKDIDIIRFRLLPEITADAPEAENALVFLNGEYQEYYVYANAKEGYIERRPINMSLFTERKDGCVLILHYEL